MTTGYVVFRLGDRRLVTALDEVREIVRLAGLEQLPGAERPLAGFLVLRGAPLPVLDVRGAGAGRDRGDVLVMESDGDQLGVAVDQVLAVVAAHDLPAGDPPAKALPPYVIGVRQDATGPVLAVDLRRLLDVTAGGWRESLAIAG